MAYLDELHDLDNEDPIGRDLMDEFDPLMINHGTFLSPAESENVARMPVHEESDTDLTDTELEDNNSLETQTEVGDDDRSPKQNQV